MGHPRDRQEYLPLYYNNNKWPVIISKDLSVDEKTALIKVNTNMIVETLPSSPIPVQDGDSQREEIDIFTNESSDSDHQDDLLLPRLPPESPDAEFDFELDAGEEILVVMNDNDELIDDECFNPGGEFDISTNDEDDDYFPFMFVIRIFLPYLIYPKVFPLLLSAENEDTIFDPGIFA
nr:hypothetical protein [Tanacetum cinerariifolium]